MTKLKITDARITPYALPLHSSWRDHAQQFTTRRGFLLRVEDDRGQAGYGDCAPLPSHGTETEATALATLESVTPRLIGISTADCLEMLPSAMDTPAARCALEVALLDLLAKQRSIPLHRWLNPESRSEVKVSANIGALMERSSERAFAAITQGYSALKLKLGISDPQRELELLTRLCNDLPASVQLRLDANMAWDLATARSFIDGIQGLPIESLEEPLAKPDIPRLQQLQGESDIHLALDETAAELDADTLSQLHPLRRIVLKPMVLGGLLPAFRMGQSARKFRIEVVVTTTIDSAAGVWAATQLAAALDTAGSLSHGLGTGDWLRQDLGRGPDIQNGTIAIPPTPGLGFIPYT